jgi:hypothetical protein
MIDAQFKSEEKYSKLSIAYEGEEESKLVCSTIDKVTAKYSIKPESYSCNISEGKDVVVLEYHDDVNREAGEVFEELICALGIKCTN